MNSTIKISVESLRLGGPFLLSLFIMFHRLIAEPSDRHNLKLWPSIKAFAQPPDVDADRVLIRLGIEAPNLVHELHSGEYCVRVAE